MHLTGQYDVVDWPQSDIFLVNSSTHESTFFIRFYDEGGKIVHKTEKCHIFPYGTIIIYLKKILPLSQKLGFFIVDCDLGIKGEYRYRNQDGVLRTTSQLKEGMPPFSAEGPTVFVSYAMKSENDKLYNLISRTLKALECKVLSASESGRADLPPGIHIRDMIKESTAVLAILTKDIETKVDGKTIFHPSHNVTEEIGQAADKPMLIMAENDVIVPSNLQTRSTYLSFSRYDEGETIVKLIESIRKIGIF